MFSKEVEKLKRIIDNKEEEIERLRLRLRLYELDIQRMKSYIERNRK